MEIYGRRKTFAVCLVLTSILTFMQFFATTIGVLTASQYLSGVVWGGYCVIATTYASEVLPLSLRGFLTGYSMYFSEQSISVLSKFMSSTHHMRNFAFKPPFELY